MEDTKMNKSAPNRLAIVATLATVTLPFLTGAAAAFSHNNLLKQMEDIGKQLEQNFERQQASADQPPVNQLRVDIAEQECDRLAAQPLDPHKVGVGVKWSALDAPRAIAACQSAVQQFSNSPRLQYQYGRALSKNRQYQDSDKWFRRAANQGYVAAQHALGIQYLEGEGVPKDVAIAVSWYRLAADQGYAAAQHALGRHYSKGEGVPKDAAVAVTWYRLAADQGYAQAKIDLKALERKLTQKSKFLGDAKDEAYFAEKRKAFAEKEKQSAEKRKAEDVAQKKKQIDAAQAGKTRYGIAITGYKDFQFGMSYPTVYDTAKQICQNAYPASNQFIIGEGCYLVAGARRALAAAFDQSAILITVGLQLGGYSEQSWGEFMSALTGRGYKLTHELTDREIGLYNSGSTATVTALFNDGAVALSIVKDNVKLQNDIWLYYHNPEQALKYKAIKISGKAKSSNF